jgi:hypothetical protein
MGPSKVRGTLCEDSAWGMGVAQLDTARVSATANAPRTGTVALQPAPRLLMAQCMDGVGTSDPPGMCILGCPGDQ